MNACCALLSLVPCNSSTHFFTAFVAAENSWHEDFSDDSYDDCKPAPMCTAGKKRSSSRKKVDPVIEIHSSEDESVKQVVRCRRFFEDFTFF